MRKLGLTLVPLVLLRAADVYALGLGDIELRSALNQPLNAEIKLLSATPAELQGLAVALAPEAAFANAGVERLGLLTQLKFNVVQKSDGSHVITVTSSQPVREPFLDFLVEVNWPAGRFVREYTLLLDPAVTENAKDTGKPELIEAPVTRNKPAPAPSPATTQGEPSPPPMAELLAKNGNGVGGITKTPRVSARQSDGLSYGPTTRTDTLWKIAEEMRTDKSVSTSQVMLALLKHNPHAFSADNVNNLMAGYILRLPSADAVRAVSPQQAASEVAAQYQQWLAVQRGEAAPARATAGTGRSPSQEGVASQGAQLKLVTPSDAKASTAGGARAGSPDTNDLASLRKELALALETAEAGRQENQELRGRLTMLEQQIATMQRLMNLKSEDLAAMQNKAAAKAPEAAAPTPATPPTPSTQPPAAVVKPQPVKASPQLEEPVATDMVGEIMSNPQQLGVIAGGFVLISALLWAMVRRRRAAALEAAENMFSRSAPPPSSSPGESAPGAEAVVASEEAIISEPAVVPPKNPAHTIQAEEGGIDPVAEADVYLAYKRYEQAESLIKDAMRHDPQRQDLVLKLLEIYHAAKNRDGFETQAEMLYAVLGGEDHPTWYKVVEMGRQLCPDHPLFAKASSTDAAVAGVALAGVVGAAMASDAMGSGDSSPDMKTTDVHEIPADLGDDFPAMGDFDALQAIDLDKEEHAAPADNLIDFEFGLDKQNADTIAFDSNEAAASLDDPLDFDLSLTGAIDSLSEAVKNTPVADIPEITGEPALFQLDDQTLAGLEDVSSAFEAESQPQPETTSDDVTPASVEPVAEAAPELSYDFTEAKEIPGHGEVVDLSVAGEEASSLTADNWDLESLASSFDGTAPEQASAQESEDDIFAGIDMVGTKLDLAKAYIDMEDKDGARMLLNEVLEEGNVTQKQEAQELMGQLA